MSPSKTGYSYLIAAGLILAATWTGWAAEGNSQTEAPGTIPPRVDTSSVTAPTPGAVTLSTSAAPAAPAAPAASQRRPASGKPKTTLRDRARAKMPPKIQKIEEEMHHAVSKTAQVAVEETKVAVKGAHSLGGRMLQGLINVMIAASPGKTRVYLPAPSSDPNSGVTVGLLPVFLFVDQKEVVRHIFAPSLTYNKIFKMTTTLRYYWYPRQGAQLFALGSYALQTNQRATLRYEDPSFFADWFYFKFDINHQYEGSNRFFGIGPDTRESDQATFTLRDNHLQVHTGLNFLWNMRLTLSHRFRRATVVDGPLGSLQRISSLRPVPPGVDQSLDTSAQRFTLSYDSRDLPIAPVRGHYASVFTEVAGGYMGGDSRYQRSGAELRGFYPLMNNRLVTGWRAMAEGIDGFDVPFYEQSLLGGKDSLRGFGDARFVDRKKATFSVEERIRFYTLNAFNVNVDFEVTPFYEAGEVFPENDLFMGSRLRHVGGVGFRTVVRPNVVGVIDMGFSDEGTALFVGIDYPF